MHFPHMKFERGPFGEGLTALLALEVPLPLVHYPDVLLQAAFLGEDSVTLLTLEVPPPLVHCSDMVLHVGLTDVFMATDGAFIAHPLMY